MTKEEDFKLLKIQTCVLRVNIHCDGCKQKVKKLLQRIEGVFQVSIDSEQQKVTVSGSVDSATLIKKLTRAGKHAEFWSQKPNQNQKQKNNCIKDEKNNKVSNNNKQQNMMKGIEAFKNQHKFAPYTLEEDDDMDDDEEDDEMDDDMRFIRERLMNQQLGLMRQQALEAEAKKGGGGGMIPGSNNGKMNHHNNNGGGNVNGGKKGNPNQNMGMKGNHPGGMDQKTMAALKMNNAHQFGGNINNGGMEGRRPNHDLSTMMNLAGFHGNGPNVASTISGLGGNPNPNTLGGGFQVQPNNGLQASAANFPSGILAGGHGHGQYPHPSSTMMNMNGYNNHPSSMMMNMNMQPRQNQAQVMYQRSTLVPPNTGYYYNYSPYPAPPSPSPSPSPSPYPYSSYPEPTYNTGGGGVNSAAHMFSDENTSGCSIM